MKLDFASIPEQTIPRFKGGEKEIRARMFWDGSTRIMRARLEPGATIGLHRHADNREILMKFSTIIHKGYFLGNLKVTQTNSSSIRR